MPKRAPDKSYTVIHRVGKDQAAIRHKLFDTHDVLPGLKEAIAKRFKSLAETLDEENVAQLRSRWVKEDLPGLGPSAPAVMSYHDFIKADLLLAKGEPAPTTEDRAAYVTMVKQFSAEVLGEHWNKSTQKDIIAVCDAYNISPELEMGFTKGRVLMAWDLFPEIMEHYDWLEDVSFTDEELGKEEQSGTMEEPVTKAPPGEARAKSKSKTKVEKAKAPASDNPVVDKVMEQLDQRISDRVDQLVNQALVQVAEALVEIVDK